MSTARLFRHLLPVTAEIAMSRCLETKACDACAVAKRRCEKQRPHCRRCRNRGIECTYPPTKPGLFRLLDGENTFSVDQDVSNFTQLLFASPLELGRVTDDGLPPGLDLSLANSIAAAQPASSWFTSPEAWKVDPSPTVPGDALCVADLKYHIKTIHQWLKQWVAKGSNPFIHKRLYQTRPSQCMQDAFMILTCYFAKTDSNEQTVFRIIEDRARQLVEDGSAGSLLGTPLDSHDHLARVQALALYQAICLYDGDIRLRHLAEGYIPVLNDWVQEMIDHAREAACLGRMVMSSPYEQTAIESSSENLLWYSWILAESIRRTSLLAASIQIIYLIQRDSTASCYGSMMFTTRQGAWDVDSAPSWEKMCSEVNVGFIQLAEAPSLLTKALPEDVDEFSKTMLAIICGAGRVNTWINR
ncbi:hypothetical protein V494_07527 [Pseudogymnoascus sp. VKM F-4513 (FW-928)]|nr:hypothetical protein V494_07527 [Pseudogymnoascus sp. VKM F-4513 (FW-928)]